MKKLFTLSAAALIATQLTCLNPRFNVKAVNEDDEYDYETSDAECKGDPGYGISNIPLEQQLEEMLMYGKLPKIIGRSIFNLI